MPYAKIENGALIYPPHNADNRINVHLNPDWLADNGYTDMAEEEIAQYAAASAPVQTVFTKLQIRRAMRALGIESTLDTILASDSTVAADWSDAQEIDLNDSVFRNAITAAGLTDEQVAEITSKIMEG